MLAAAIPGMTVAATANAVRLRIPPKDSAPPQCFPCGCQQDLTARPPESYSGILVFTLLFLRQLRLFLSRIQPNAPRERLCRFGTRPITIGTCRPLMASRPCCLRRNFHGRVHLPATAIDCPSILQVKRPVIQKCGCGDLSVCQINWRVEQQGQFCCVIWRRGFVQQIALPDAYAIPTWSLARFTVANNSVREIAAIRD